jgi:hypothetical protein
MIDCLTPLAQEALRFLQDGDIVRWLRRSFMQIRVVAANADFNYVRDGKSARIYFIG